MSIDFTRYLRSVFPAALSITTPATAAASVSPVAAIPVAGTASDAIIVGSCSTVPTRVTPLSDAAAGPRVVSSPVAGLVVGLAPVDQVDALTVFPHFGAVAAYACIAQGSVDMPEIDLRPGETVDTPRRIAEHLAHPPCTIEQILLVGSADPVFSPFGKDEILALQWILHRLAVRAARATVHGATPQRPVLLDIEPARLARWGSDLRPLLMAAGIPFFEPQGRVIRPVVIEPTEPGATGDGAEGGMGNDAALTLSRGYVVELPRGLTEREHARRYSLSIRRARALATVVDGLVVVHAGAILDPSERSGVQSCIVRKRQRLLEQGILQWTQDGLLRLTRDLGLPTLTNAARALSCSNVPGDAWIEMA